MDNYERITEGFQETIDAVTQSVDVLAQPMELATSLLVNALLNEGKVMCCGTGSNAAMAQLMVSSLLNRFEHERPGLPAINLCSDAATLAAISSTYSINDIFSKQIRALGQSADILIAISNESSNSSIIQAISAAHERGITVISLSGGSSLDVPSLLLPEDIELVVSAVRAPRITEVHAMVIHQLCELIDHALFGTYES
ncbi:MAG: D-sedoheptulose 7-phosphate isomerase [Halieaceae bacterium]|jgi:D-sedoheptulose 7-phosphate isomerase